MPKKAYKTFTKEEWDAESKKVAEYFRDGYSDGFNDGFRKGFEAFKEFVEETYAKKVSNDEYERMNARFKWIEGVSEDTKRRVVKNRIFEERLENKIDEKYAQQQAENDKASAE